MKLLILTPIITAIIFASVSANQPNKEVIKAVEYSSVVNTSNVKKIKKKKPVWLKPGVIGTTLVVNGKPFVIDRNQDRRHLIAKIYQKTGRGIIKPMHPFKPHAVETIAEHEMISYISRLSSKKGDVVVVDARKSIWPTLTGSLPGAIHVPFHRFKKNKKYALETLEDEFGVVINTKGEMNFSNAKILAVYCNGNWCKMSPELIWELLDYGYPANKIKYYRGGMQAWQLLGLTTVD